MEDKRTTFVYSSCLMSQKTLDSLFAKIPNMVGLQAQKYHRLIAEGLSKNNANVCVVSFQLGTEKLEEIPSFESDDNICFSNIICRKRILRHFNVTMQSYKTTKALLKKNKNAFLICDVLNYSVALGSVLAAKKLNVKTIGIITDFPEYLGSKKSIKVPLMWRLIKKFDAYILLTRKMSERISNKKNYIVLEGQSDSKETIKTLSLCRKYDDFVCMYAGLLDIKYGIKNLVEGFLGANVPNSKLIIFGNGDYSEELVKIKDPRIDFRGLCPNEDVLEEEKRATLLINPRPTNDEYTLYSFPSKTIEYMTSGTPLLTTKLPGIPIEYFDYVYTFDNYDVDSIAKKIKELSMLKKEELFGTGNKARLFVLEKKNNVVQTRKIIDFANGLK